jgi:hypothetical protein
VVPGATVEVDAARRRLIVRCPATAGGAKPAEWNRTVLEWLLERRVDILSVRRGAELEAAYLEHRRRETEEP